MKEEKEKKKCLVCFLIFQFFEGFFKKVYPVFALDITIDEDEKAKSTKKKTLSWQSVRFKVSRNKASNITKGVRK